MNADGRQSPRGRKVAPLIPELRFGNDGNAGLWMPHNPILRPLHVGPLPGILPHHQRCQRGPMNLTLRSAVSAFGADAKAKLANPAATGEPEDQLRAPLERLV